MRTHWRLLSTRAAGSFAEFGLTGTLLSGLRKQRMFVPTQIQERVLDKLIPKVDEVFNSPRMASQFVSTPNRSGLIIHSEPGSGKSLSFLLPVLDQLLRRAEADRLSNNIHAMIFVPNHQLGLQLEGVINSLTKSRILVEFLELAEPEELRERLRKNRPNIVITTPGKFLKVLGGGRRSGKVITSSVQELSEDLPYLEDFRQQLESLKCVIMDEANQVMKVTSRYSPEKLKQKRQKSPPVGCQAINVLVQMSDPVLVFSCATVNYAMRRMIKAQNWALEPVLVDSDKCRSLPLAVKHSVRLLPWNLALRGVVDSLVPSEMTLIVVHEGDWREVIQRLADEFGVTAVEMTHDCVEGVVVATPESIRGVDFQQKVSHVIMVGNAKDSVTYVHAAGRTGRMGNPGRVTTIIPQSDLRRFRTLTRFMNADVRIEEDSSHSIAELLS